MIYYFSGTGNSKAIAEEIADYIGTKAVDIIGVDIDQIHLEDEEYVGFTFPIYAWAAPEVMLQFAQKIKYQKQLLHLRSVHSVMLPEWHFSIFQRLFL